jgi:hypothetical protein
MAAKGTATPLITGMDTSIMGPAGMAVDTATGRAGAVTLRRIVEAGRHTKFRLDLCCNNDMPDVWRRRT